MAFAKFEGNRFRIDGEIAENHAILVNLTASIDPSIAPRLDVFHSMSKRLYRGQLGQYENKL